jgi:ABC-type Zn uptake system ZnuABC Zn-binding protein ZnuA
MSTKKLHFSLFVVIISLLLTLSACAPAQTESEEGGSKLQVVATTTFVGDVVAEVGGESIDLTVMLAPGANPHAYEPTPQDIVAVADADVVFANGLDLEEFLDDLIANAGGDAELVHVSEGIELRYFDADHEHGHEHEGEEHHDEEEHEHEGEEHPDEEGDDQGADPHVWFDPNNVIVWTENIEATLSRLDPDNAATYQANADAYRAELKALDAWIREQVEQIPAENRKLVTDHTSFGYFADEYGFEQIGAVIDAPTTEAEPSGQQLAQLQDAILQYDVKAIFVGRDFDPTLSERVAEDTGVDLVPLYFGSLTPPGGEADTYLEFIRYDVEAIVEALK